LRGNRRPSTVGYDTIARLDSEREMERPGLPLDLRQAFDAQRAAAAREPFPDWPRRRARLQRLRRLIAENEGAIAQAIDADFGGRPAIETEMAEIWPTLEEIKVALRHGARWMKPRRVGVSRWFLPAAGEILPQPLGVIGVIAPWNYPLLLSAGPVAGALAAGNRVLVKLSEHTPNVSALLQSLVATDFSFDELCIVTGDATVAAEFSRLPFDHLLFTGSTKVGHDVMQAAAANLTPVTLELGGKSPAIIAPGYPLAHAIERVLMGKLLNAGQTCIATDHVRLPRGEIEAFVQGCIEQACRMYPRGLDDAEYCSIIDERQYRRLTGGIDEAIARGARCQILFESGRDAARRRLAPVIVIDPPDDLRLMREEIFGPVLPVIPYDEIEQALAQVNARPRPLALYWFDRDPARSERALRATHAGGVCINDTLLHIAQPTLPFGGVGPSGMGHYHGRWGFDTFSKLKPVFRQRRFNAMKVFLPPYSGKMRALLRLMKRF